MVPKILIVGGISSSIINFRLDLIKTWQSYGYQVIAVASPAANAKDKKISEAGIIFKPIPIRRDGLNPAHDIKALSMLAALIKNEKPEIIFAYTAKPVILSGACKYFIKGSRLYSMITGLGYAFSGSSLKQRIIKWLQLNLYKMALKNSDAVIFQNEDDRTLFQDQNITSRSQKTIVVNGSGVNLNYFYFSSPRYEKEIIFLMMARLLISKGVSIYAEAAAKIKAEYPQAKFMLLGALSSGPDGVDADTISRWHNEGVLNYLGRRDDVRAYIEKCSVYVLPSFYREGIPRSILEAMSMGRAIITTDNVGCRETVVNGLNGYLVPVKDSYALAEAMKKFIANPYSIKMMGLESRKIAEEKFDVKIINGSILEAMGIS